MNPARRRPEAVLALATLAPLVALADFGALARPREIVGSNERTARAGGRGALGAW